jgi:hypothetical protein
MSSLNLPSTTVKSKYLKCLPIQTTYQDPINGYFYQVVEKEFNSSLIKAALPSFDGTKAIKIDVPEKFLKLQNTTRPNINALMKQRLTELEAENKCLKSNKYRCTTTRIKEQLNGKCYYESEDYFYCFKDNIIVPVKKSKYPKVEDALQKHESTMEEVWKDSDILHKVIQKQDKLQETLLALLFHEATSGSYEKVIEL